MRNSALHASRTETVININKQEWLRSVLFSIGDLLFLLLVSAMATTATHFIHELGWNFVLTLIIGMIVAMIIQMLLALSVAPILGSIESMVPSMVVAMISPMVLCALDFIGYGLSWSESAALGAAVGLIIFIFIEVYGYRYRRHLRQAYPDK